MKYIWVVLMVFLFRGHKTKRIFKREPENGGRT